MMATKMMGMDAPQLARNKQVLLPCLWLWVFLSSLWPCLELLLLSAYWANQRLQGQLNLANRDTWKWKNLQKFLTIDKTIELPVYFHKTYLSSNLSIVSLSTIVLLK